VRHYIYIYIYIYICISGLENRDYGRRDPPLSSRDTPVSAKVDTNFADKRWSLKRIVRSRTKVTELLYIYIYIYIYRPLCFSGV
jgi:hypothetical protein